jgi:hypothetical protein
VTALAAITIKNATSEILNRLDFFMSVISELITASYGRHDKGSAEKRLGHDQKHKPGKCEVSHLGFHPAKKLSQSISSLNAVYGLA